MIFCNPKKKLVVFLSDLEKYPEIYGTIGEVELQYLMVLQICASFHVCDQFESHTWFSYAYEHDNLEIKPYRREFNSMKELITCLSDFRKEKLNLNI